MKIQILKGDVLKSETVQYLLDNTNSNCVVYNEELILPLNSNYINSKENTLVQLRIQLHEIQTKIILRNPDTIFDYFIIYTNKKEDEISGFIGWLDQHFEEFNSRCVLLTCKP